MPDALHPAQVADGLAALLEAGLAARRPEAAREAFCRERSMAGYARGLCDAIGVETAPGRAVAA